MKCRRLVVDTSMILAIDLLETSFSRSIRISPSLPLSFEVPLGPDGYFHLPLFSILNWYALLVGLFGLVVLAAHGARFLAAMADDVLAARAGRWARGLWWGELALVLGAPPLVLEVETMGCALLNIVYGPIEP